MNLYLDEDTANRRLVTLLSNAGHSITVPTDIQLSGASDARHLIYTIQHSLVLMTRNHDDFFDLHEVILTAQGMHPGILVIRLDNDPTRDMTLRQIVTAIANLETSGIPFTNEVYILNHWR